MPAASLEVIMEYFTMKCFTIPAEHSLFQTRVSEFLSKLAEHVGCFIMQKLMKITGLSCYPTFFHANRLDQSFQSSGLDPSLTKTKACSLLTS